MDIFRNVEEVIIDAVGGDSVTAEQELKTDIGLDSLSLVAVIVGRSAATSGISPKALIVCAVGFACAIAAELAATAGMSLIDWEAEWAESGTALAVGMVAAAVVAIIALLVIKRNAGKKAAVNGNARG